MGCEWVDMELCWSESARTGLIEGRQVSKCGLHRPQLPPQRALTAACKVVCAPRFSTCGFCVCTCGRILASYHDLSVEPSWSELAARATALAHGGRVQAVKLVSRASTLSDCMTMNALRTSRTDGLPMIGAYSRWACCAARLG